MSFRQNAPSLFHLVPNASKESLRAGARFFLAVLIALLCQTAFAGTAGQPPLVKQTEFVYVVNHDSNDIFGFHVDSVTGSLTPIPDLPLSLDFAPASIASSPDGRFLYVTGENKLFIWVYKIDNYGRLSQVRGSPVETAGVPGQITLDKEGKHLYAGCEALAAVMVFAIDEEHGLLSPVSGSPFPLGTAPQAIAIDKSGNFAYIADETSGSIDTYAIDRSSGKLSRTGISVVSAGISPARMFIAPSSRQLLVANAGSDSVSVFSVDSTRGLLNPVEASPFSTVHSPGDLAEIGTGSRFVVGSSKGAGLSAITVASASGGTAKTQIADASEAAISSSGTFALGSDATGQFLFAAEAESNTITRYRIDPRSDTVVPGSGLTYATGISPVSIAVVNRMVPPASESITVSLAQGSMLTFSSTTGNVHISAPAVKGSDITCAGQVVQLSFNVPSIAVISTATQNPATSVCIPTGQQDASFAVTTTANSGSAVLTAFATGFNDGTFNISVNLRSITISLPYTTVGTGHSVTGTITLANPAPAGGVTFSLSSDAPQTATFTSTTGGSTVFIAANSSSVPVMVNGIQANSANVTASVASGGYTSRTVAVKVLPPGLTISLPKNAVVAPGQSLPYPISIGAPAASAVSVSFITGGGPGTSTISPNPVTIPVGATAPTTQPSIKGGAIGGLTVTASASGYASDTENATVQITLTFNPLTLSVETGKTGNLTLSASSVAPAGGFTITLTSTDPTKATVGSSIVIPAGSSSVTVPVTGVAAGSTTINASAPGAIRASAAITVYAPPAITLYGPSGSSFTMGYNSEVPVSGSLAFAAPAPNLPITITTPAGSNLLVSNTLTGSGSHSITVTAAAGSTSIPTFYVQATASSGSATVTASANGYSNGSATASFTPSGFMVQGGTSTTTFSTPSQVTVSFAQLNPGTLTFFNWATLRAGVGAVVVPLKETDTPAGVGSLGAASITFTGGNTNHTTTYQPKAAGTSVIGFGTLPAGYSVASNYATTTFTVTAPDTQLSVCGSFIDKTGSTTIGYNMQCTAAPYLAAPAPTGGRAVTLTSSDTSKLLLSTSATAAGTGSITVNIAAGSSSGPTFYVQALASTGSATITETASGYNLTTVTMNFTPSGFMVQGGTSTTTFSTPSQVTVSFAQLNPGTLTFFNWATLRAGVGAVVVPLKETDTPAGVGSLGAASITFTGGNTNHTTTYQPKAAGTSVIGFGTLPAGYSVASNYATTTFTVTAPDTQLSVCGSFIDKTGSTTIGYNMQCTAAPYLAAPAPTGGRAVTLTSSDTSKLLLSTSATAAGTGSITVNIAAGSSSGPTFYVQALASTGSATITETASGYNLTTVTMNFTPSGFMVQGGTSTTTFSTPSQVTVSFAQLNPGTLTFFNWATLRAGVGAVVVPLKETDTPAGVGSLGAASITFTGGNTNHTTTYQPKAAGTSVIGFGTLPAGYSVASNYATTTFTVTAPDTQLSVCGSFIDKTGSTTIGYNMQCTAAPYLAAPAPTGGRAVTLTSSDTSKLLLSTSATAAGTGSITVNIAAGSSSGPTFYVQALASTGSATITETASGYNLTTVTMNFTPSGFMVQGGTSTTTFSTPSQVTVSFAQLNPGTLTFFNWATLRAGVGAVVVPLKETDTPAGVGSLGAASITFTGGNTNHTTTYQPKAAGTSVIGFGTLPAGYSVASNYATTTFTVTAPDTQLSVCGSFIDKTGSTTIGYNMQCTAAPYLAAPAPTGGRAVTLTSSDTSKLLLSTSATAAGTGSITVNIAAGSSSGPTFYVQALASTGSATITETASGYNLTTVTMNFTPSGFMVQGGTSTTTFSTPSQVTVSFAQLNPGTLTFFNWATLRAGVGAVVVPLKETDTPAGVGSLGAASITFTGGNTNHTTTYQPKAAGTSVIGFGTLPAGYSVASNYATTTFTVTAPSITLQPLIVGNYMQTTTYGYLQVGAPTGGRTVTITAPSSILLSTSPSTKGSSTLSFNLAAGQSSIPSFYVQSQGGGAGTVNLSVTASGYANGTGTVTVYPSGFALQGSNFTTHVTDNPTTLTIVPAALDATFHNIYQVQELIPNLPIAATATLQLTVQSGTGVGSFSLKSVTFKGNDNPNYLTSSFIPKSVGSALITITSSTGFTNASSQITASVIP